MDDDGAQIRTGLRRALVMAGCANVVVAAMFLLLLSSPARSRALRLGPVPFVAGDVVRLDTWPRFLVAMGLMCLLEVCESFSQKMVRNWYRNSLRDPKSCSVGLRRHEVHLFVSATYVLGILPHFFRFIITFLTRQLQFLVPGYLMRIVISAWYDGRSYTKKEKSCDVVS